jgi:ribosomal protein L29
MKTKEFKDLRAKDIKALQKMAHEKRVEIMKKNMMVMGGREKNVKLVGILRRELAKILTLVREKEIIEKLEANKK